MSTMRCSTCGGATERETCDACGERELGRRERHRREQLAWLYTCARRAVKLARTYSIADGEGGLRARGCLAQVKAYRKDIRGLRLVAHGLPGLTKARPLVPEQERAESTG
jgi:RecJ-like exonuclease